MSDRTFAAFLILFGIFGAIGFSENTSVKSRSLLQDFQSGWDAGWKEKILASKGNRYLVVEEDGNRVLKFDSDNSASGIWYKWKIEPILSGKISWRWKVESSLTKNHSEREKRGDDYAARVFVVFEPSFFSWKTRSVCYVWAGNEAPGTIFESPYAASVATIVLESGNQKAGQWIQEDRNFVADYNKFFGTNPTKVSAFAVMVDTDNTAAKTSAWFDDLIVEVDGGFD